MNKLEAYNLLARILSLDIIPENKEIIIKGLRESSINWEKFVGLADYHLILPALFPRIKDYSLQEYFPSELLPHLSKVTKLNEKRNSEIINQVYSINKALEEAGIRPVFMKGAGNLADELYLYPGDRLLHDIDVLVSDTQFESAAGILINNGYQSNFQYDPQQKMHLRHYPILFKKGEPAYLELHRTPVSEKYLSYLNTEMIINASKPGKDYPGILVLSDDHKIIHNFIHSHLDHYSNLYAREFIRNLYDLLLLSFRKDPEKVLQELGYLSRNKTAYLDIFYKTFALKPKIRFVPPFYLHVYRSRYIINLRYPVINNLSLLILRLFSSFIKKPLLAIKNPSIRRNILEKVLQRSWYKKQIAYYKKVFGKK